MPSLPPLACTSVIWQQPHETLASRQRLIVCMGRSGVLAIVQMLACSHHCWGLHSVGQTTPRHLSLPAEVTYCHSRKSQKACLPDKVWLCSPNEPRCQSVRTCLPRITCWYPSMQACTGASCSSASQVCHAARTQMECCPACSTLTPCQVRQHPAMSGMKSVAMSEQRPGDMHVCDQGSGCKVRSLSFDPLFSPT